MTVVVPFHRPGAVNVLLTTKATARTNRRVITSAAIEIGCVALAVFTILYCWMGP